MSGEERQARLVGEVHVGLVCHDDARGTPRGGGAIQSVGKPMPYGAFGVVRKKIVASGQGTGPASVAARPAGRARGTSTSRAAAIAAASTGYSE